MRGEKNEEIRLLQGSEAEMHAAMRDAEAAGAKYGLRHYKISPKEEMTTDDARLILADLGREFGFDADRATLIEHQKPRAQDGGFDRHWHAIVPEVDPINGRVLDSHWMRPRHEKIARIAEARLGHEVVPGRFNAAVQRALADEGQHEIAERIQHATEVPRPTESYRTKTHQQANRLGHNLPADRLLIRDAWERSDNGQSFAAALAEHGIRITEGEKEGVFVAHRDQDFLGAIHRLVGIPKHEASERLTAAPLEQPAPEAPAPQPEPPNPGGGVPAPAMAAPPQDAAPAAQGQQQIESAPAHAHAHAGDTQAAAAPQPSGGGGGGGGGSSSPAPAAEAPKPGGCADIFGGEDPTAGIEPPKVGDLAGELRYREAVMKKAAEIAEKKARAAKPAPNQQGGKNVQSGIGGGGSGGGEKAAAALAAAAHEALLELIERGRKAREQREFDELLDAYLEAAGIRHEARRRAAPAHRDGERPPLAESSARDGHSRRDEPTARRGEPDAAPGNSANVERGYGGSGEDRSRIERAAAALERRFEAARVERGFEGVDLSQARETYEKMMRGPPRPDPLEGLTWEEAKTRKDTFRQELWEQFSDDGKVLFEFDLMDRREARAAEIEAAAPIRERMKERWPRLNQAQMKRAREVIKEHIKAAGDEVREQQKQRPPRDFNDYVRGLAEHFNDERAVFVCAYEDRRKAQKDALFRPVQEALEAIAQERAKAPKPRNPDEEAKTARRSLWAPYEAAQERLKEARETFEKMDKPSGWRWLNSAAYDAYDAARDRMNVAQAECESVKPKPSKLEDAEEKARFSAQVGHGEYQRWQNARGHNLDQREAALLAVRDAMESGDKQMIRTMRAGGIDAALELQRKRDEEERKAREAALKAANVVQMRGNQKGMEMPTPRMR